MKTTCCISLYGISFFFRYMAVCRPIYYRQMSKRSSGLHRYREISPILEELYLVLQGIPITVSHFLCWALIFIYFYASRLKCRWRRVATCNSYVGHNCLLCTALKGKKICPLATLYLLTTWESEIHTFEKYVVCTPNRTCNWTIFH